LISEELRYKYFEWVFYNLCPKKVQSHRRYFSKESRGFGEDAMHGMWWKIFHEFEPRRTLEIGVYRGQTISLWALIAQIREHPIDVWGVSPLNDSGDEVSDYVSIDYEQDIKANHAEFQLGEPNLVKGLSTELTVKEFVSENTWDVVYLDGSHDLEVVRQDLKLVSNSLKKGGLLVLDDASLYSNFEPPKYAFAGHPGPSTVAIELNQSDIFKPYGSCGHNRLFLKVT
jgi:hypothetical protein